MQQDRHTQEQPRAEWTRPTLDRLGASAAELQGGVGGDAESETS